MLTLTSLVAAAVALGLAPSCKEMVGRKGRQRKLLSSPICEMGVDFPDRVIIAKMFPFSGGGRRHYGLGRQRRLVRSFAGSHFFITRVLLLYNVILISPELVVFVRTTTTSEVSC